MQIIKITVCLSSYNETGQDKTHLRGIGESKDPIQPTVALAVKGIKRVSKALIGLRVCAG